MNDNIHFGKSVSEAQAEFEDGDVWTNQLEGVPVGQRVDGASQVIAEASADEEGIEVLRPTRELEKQGKRDYDWTRDPDLDHPAGMTLAGEERMLGREQEMERQRERALHFHEADTEVERARSARVQADADARQKREDFAERADLAADRDPETDPREKMDPETLGRINELSRTVAEKFEDGPTYAAVSKEIAEKVDSGTSPGEAALAVTERLVGSEWAVVPIGRLEESMADWRSQLRDEWDGTTTGELGSEMSIEDWQEQRYPNKIGSFEASIQGEVTALWEPSRGNQQQVGEIRGETGTAKVTIWRSSNCETVLREGDTVRFRGLKVDWYEGRPSLSATSDAEITVLERGDGEEPIHGHLNDDRLPAWKEHGRQGEEPTVPAFRADSQTHEWIIQTDMDSAIEATLDDEEEGVADEREASAFEWVEATAEREE
jgi:hypothetical protein